MTIDHLPLIHVVVTSPWWTPFVGLFGGIVGFGANMAVTSLQKRSESNKARVQFKMDSDSACYRTISPRGDELARDWDLLGGGKNAGAVSPPSTEWSISAGRFEQTYYQVTFFDHEAERLLRTLFETARGFHIASTNLEENISYAPLFGDERKALQDARTALTEKFREVYKDWKINMRNTVGMHRVESYGPTTPTLPHDPSATVSVPHNPAKSPRLPAKTSGDDEGTDDA